MRDTPMQKMTYLIEEIDDAAYNDRGYSFISGLLDELKEDIAQNFAPGIVVPENKEITYQNDHKKGIIND